MVASSSRQLGAHAHCEGSRYSDLGRVKLIAVVNEVGCLDLASSVRAPSLLEPPDNSTPSIQLFSLAGFMIPSKRAVVSKHLSAVGRASSSVSGFRGIPSHSLRTTSGRRDVFASKGRVSIPVLKPRVLHRSYASESRSEFPCPETIVILNTSESFFNRVRPVPPFR